MTQRETICGENRKNDALIRYVSTNEPIEVVIISKNHLLFGQQIHRTVLEVLGDYHITCGRITVEDGGALDFVIRARLKTALERMGLHEQ